MGDNKMSRTIRSYNIWYKNENHPFFKRRHNAKYWQQWRYGKSSCVCGKDADVMIHVHNKRKRILLKKRKFDLI